MQIDETDIIYIIVYNSGTTVKVAMPLRGAQSRFKRFLSSDVKSYGKEKYSVIHILYNFIIHCFDNKQLCYALRKLEYARITQIIVQLFYEYTV